MFPINSLTVKIFIAFSQMGEWVLCITILLLGKNDTSLDDKNLIKTEHEIDRKYWCREDHSGKLIYVLMILRDLRLTALGGKVGKGWDGDVHLHLGYI